MPQEITSPLSFANLILSRAYPTWAKPEPADNPTRHRKTYTFLRAIAAARDGVANAALSAARCHLPAFAPDNALTVLGETFGGLARAIIDTADTYRAYLTGPLDRWATFGTVSGLKAELAHIGFPDTYVISWRDLVDAGAGLPGTVFGGNTSFFYVGIRAPNPLDPPAHTWGGGGSWGTSGWTWGAGSATAAQRIEEIRRVIAKVKPAHTSCRFICVFNDLLSGPDAQLLPSGTFHAYPCNEPWERVRPTYAFHDYYTNGNPLVP